ncbi:uncharacterized protein LOC142178805 [Nicotiana tabacum]|uniref:Uncharacterized protein LOC142178805 n=1 Tax=Nicotiana tabacum TaxID=4097 RepID=A0AC58U572_TOBAC
MIVVYNVRVKSCPRMGREVGSKGGKGDKEAYRLRVGSWNIETLTANSSFPKREEHLVTFRSTVATTQIDYLLCRKCDRGLCMDCKVIPSECLMTQHRLIVMDLGIKRNRKKRAVCSQPRVKWGNLTKDKAQELGERLLAMGAWKNSGDGTALWAMKAKYIREAAREVLGVTKGYPRRRIGDWW